MSISDLERLIKVKRCEIEREKILLGLTEAKRTDDNEEKITLKEINEEFQEEEQNNKNVTFQQHTQDKKEIRKCLEDLETDVPVDLERYIRRYLGLPVMLKTGEYSPNNPLLRADKEDRSNHDVFIGLGEYEERKKRLRKLRQQEYRDYLQQQARKKHEAKETESMKSQRQSPIVEIIPTESQNNRLSKVDTGIQCEAEVLKTPLSIGVQTDDTEIMNLSEHSSQIAQKTQAERELSPRTVIDTPNNPDDRPIKPGLCPTNECPLHKAFALKSPSQNNQTQNERRRSYGDFDERTKCQHENSNRDKLMSDLRHSYMPSLFDSDAIQMRNIRAQQDAAEKRHFYQQELRNQIREQQMIREERKAREKMLEQAEMRRLEEQLKMIRVAQEKEVHKHHHITNTMKNSATEYNFKRDILQNEIDDEKHNLFRATSQPSLGMIKKRSDTKTAISDTTQIIKPITDRHYSTNIPDNSIFSPSYDVDTYLRKNLNPSKESLLNKLDQKNDNYVPSFLKKDLKDLIVTDETLPIPVLRHSPKMAYPELDCTTNDISSDAMKKVEDKWKVPVVQRNILKSLPNNDGKNVNILTQLGSIRRQLQLEQLKLDKMLPKDNIV